MTVDQVRLVKAQQLKALSHALYSLNSAEAWYYSGHLRGSAIERGIREKKKEKDNRGNEEKKKSSQHSGYKQTSRAKEVGCVR
jgi:hypothetical protein